MSKPTIDIWWPRTIQPKNGITNKAIIMESLPKIIHKQDLESISLIKPKAGKISMWASGWLENQKRCWKGKRSPPLNGSENDVLKCLSKIIVVIHPASTGREIDNKKEVKNILQGNRGKNNDIWITERLDAFNEVTIKLIDPDKGLNPTKCKEKNIISIEEEFIIDGGTWNVQPAFTPPSIVIPKNIKNNESISNHKLKAFNLGNIMSDEQGSRGKGILPNPPINIGIIIKKVVNNPWKVMRVLYWREERIGNPGKANSNRIIVGNP